jgi:hypothetical protein
MKHTVNASVLATSTEPLRLDGLRHASFLPTTDVVALGVSRSAAGPVFSVDEVIREERPAPAGRPTAA